MFLQNLFSALGAISFILFPLSKKKKKLKRRRLKKKKKQKKKRKKESLFISIFIPISFQKKEGKQKKKRIPSCSIFLYSPSKKRRKETKRMKKEEKKKFFHFSLIPSPCSHFPKRTKIKKKNGRKYARFQGHGKEKDLVRPETNKV